MATKFLGVEIPEGTEERGSTQSNDKYRYYTAAEIASGGGPTYVEVNVTKEQILAMGTNPVPLLPATSSTQYYDIEKIIIEPTKVSTAYSFPGGNIPGLYNGNTSVNLDSLTLNCANDGLVMIIKDLNVPQDGGSDFFVGSGVSAGEALTMTTYNGGNPTTGNGTYKVKIWYKIGTLG